MGRARNGLGCDWGGLSPLCSGEASLTALLSGLLKWSGHEQTMDRFDGCPRTIHDICQNNDIDILLGVVADDRTHPGVVALFLGEYNVACLIHSELYPIAEHMLPFFLHMM